jgi:hypothetical protein
VAKNEVFDGTKWNTQFYDANDALKERPPTEYIIQDILPAASLSIFYGAPGSGKTNIVMDLCACCALGKRWLTSDTFDGFETKRVPVLWVDVDCGANLLHERWGAVLRGHGKNEIQRRAVKLQYASFLDPAFVANNDASVNEIIARANKIGARIIVFDNLGNISGGMDENTSQMIQVVAHLRYIAERTNSAVVVIHHVAKNSDTPRRSSRGHGSIDASADNAFYVESDDETLLIQQTKARRHKLPLFGAIFDYTHRDKTSDLYSFYFSGVEPELPKHIDSARRVLLEYLQKHKRANQSALVEILMKNKLSKHKALGILLLFTKCNLLKVLSGQAHNQKLYEIGNREARISLLR